MNVKVAATLQLQIQLDLVGDSMLRGWALIGGRVMLQLDGWAMMVAGEQLLKAVHTEVCLSYVFQVKKITRSDKNKYRTKFF